MFVSSVSLPLPLSATFIFRFYLPFYSPPLLSSSSLACQRLFETYLCHWSDSGALLLPSVRYSSSPLLTCLIVLLRSSVSPTLTVNFPSFPSRDLFTFYLFSVLTRNLLHLCHLPSPLPFAIFASIALSFSVALISFSPSSKVYIIYYIILTPLFSILSPLLSLLSSLLNNILYIITSCFSFILPIIYSPVIILLFYFPTSVPYI